MFGSATADTDLLAKQMYQLYGNQGLQGWSGDWNQVNSAANWEEQTNTPNLARAGFSPASDSLIDYTTLGVWARTGYGTAGAWSAGGDDTSPGSGFDEESQLVVQTKVTLEIKTLKPKVQNMWTPS